MVLILKLYYSWLSQSLQFINKMYVFYFMKMGINFNINLLLMIFYDTLSYYYFYTHVILNIYIIYYI